MFKKILIPLLFLLSVGAAYYFWSSFTKVPQWYQTQDQATEPNSTPDDLEMAQARIQAKVEQQIQQQLDQDSQLVSNLDTEGDREVSIQLNEQDINQLIQSRIAEDDTRKSLLSKAKSIQTQINDDTIEIGTVVNPSEISAQDLDNPRLEKALNQVAQLNRQDIYIGLEGKPRVEAGKLVFDRDSKVKIGSLSLSLAEAAQQLGLPPEEILRRLELEVGQFDLQDIELGDREALFKVAIE